MTPKSSPTTARRAEGTHAGLSPTALAGLATELRLACMRISRRVRYEGESPIRPHEFSVLCRLEQGPRTPREVADIERVSAPSMTRTVAGLVERGLVARADDPTDGRQVILSLTPEGVKVLRGIRRQRDRWMHVRLRDLTPEEQETLARAVEILQRVAAK